MKKQCIALALALIAPIAVSMAAAESNEQSGDQSAKAEREYQEPWCGGPRGWHGHGPMGGPMRGRADRPYRESMHGRYSNEAARSDSEDREGREGRRGYGPMRARGDRPYWESMHGRYHDEAAKDDSEDRDDYGCPGWNGHRRGYCW